MGSVHTVTEFYRVTGKSAAHKVPEITPLNDFALVLKKESCQNAIFPGG